LGGGHGHSEEREYLMQKVRYKIKNDVEVIFLLKKEKIYLSILKDGEPIYITHSSDNFNNEKLYFITPTTFNTTTQKYDPYSIKLVATTNTIENSSEILDNLPDPNK
jgi:hypothetical protein